MQENRHRYGRAQAQSQTQADSEAARSHAERQPRTYVRTTRSQNPTVANTNDDTREQGGSQRFYGITPPFDAPRDSTSLYAETTYFLIPKTAAIRRRRPNPTTEFGLRSVPKLPKEMWRYSGNWRHYLCVVVLVCVAYGLFMGLHSLNDPSTNYYASEDSGVNRNDYINKYKNSYILGKNENSGDTPGDLFSNLAKLINLDDHKEEVVQIPKPVDGSEDSSIEMKIYYQRTSEKIYQALRSPVHAKLYRQLYSLHPERPGESAMIEKGILLLFHGCTHDGSTWFKLPEERRIVRYALATGYSVLSFTSRNRVSGCWLNSWPLKHHQDNEDVRRVAHVLTQWLRDQYRDLNEVGSHPPLFVIGASSGGAFATIISRALPTVAQVIQISPGSEGALFTMRESNRPPESSAHYSSAALASANTLYPVPATYFLYMGRDHFAPQMHNYVSRLRGLADQLGPRIRDSRGIVETELRPRAITSTFLSSRIDGFSLESSDYFFKRCYEETFVDRYGFLKENPRTSGMLNYLIDAINRYVAEVSLVNYQFKSDDHSAEDRIQRIAQQWNDNRAGIEEELNVLYCQHEATSDHVEEIMQWLDGHRFQSLQDD